MLIFVKDRSFWINIKVIGYPVNDHMGSHCLEKIRLQTPIFHRKLLKEMVTRQMKNLTISVSS